YLRAVSGASWASDNLDDVLASVSPELANRRALPHGKTIHELLRHLVYTEQVVTERLMGQFVPWDYEAAWVPPPPDAKAWENSLREIQDTRSAFLETLDRFTDEQLDQPLTTEHSSAYVHLHGHIQHTLYHLGQIAMLRSLLDQA